MKTEQIKKAATDFRNSIEACSKHLGISFENFPRGSCGDVTPLLGTYLRELGLGEFLYICGEPRNKSKNTWFSHAWLQSNTLIVDITADQFPENSEKIIVSNNSIWHEKLEAEPQGIADYRNYDSYTVSNLSKLYKIIIENIKLK